MDGHAGRKVFGNDAGLAVEAFLIRGIRGVLAGSEFGFAKVQYVVITLDEHVDLGTPIIRVAPLEEKALLADDATDAQGVFDLLDVPEADHLERKAFPNIELRRRKAVLEQRGRFASLLLHETEVKEAKGVDYSIEFLRGSRAKGTILFHEPAGDERPQVIR